MKFRHIFLLAFVLATLPAFGQLVLVGGCSATAATSCTPATVGGHSFASGQLIYTFAFRTATTAPTLSSSPTFTALDTASASASSFRSGCAVSTSGSPSSGTWANATRVVTLIYSGSPATTTANCASSGVGGKTTAGTSGTTSTITYTGITLTHGDGSSWVIGAAGGSAAVCTPATILHSEESATDLVGNDTNGGVTSFSTLTCTGSAGNWKSDTVELLSTTLATPTYTPDAGGFTTVGGVYVTIGLAGGATGCYTTDNSTPTASAGSCTHGSPYSAPVLISTSGTVLQAIATETGFANSAVKNSTFTLTTPFSMLSLMGTGVGGFAGGLSLPVGWLAVEDNGDGDDCSGTTTSCSPTKFAPVQSGDLVIICAGLPANDTISTITGTTGGSWQTMSGGHGFSATAGGFDCQFNAGLTAGTFTPTVTLTTQDLGYVLKVEIQPPAGYTASFDVATNGSASSCTTCTGPSISLSATDAVVYVWAEANSPVFPFTFSSPFITGLSNEGIATNVSGTVQPTAGQSPAGDAAFVAMAFKSSAGTFSVPAPVFTWVALTAVPGGESCGPACPAITLNGTPAAGDLLFVQAADLQNGGYISSINDGHSGAFTIPSPGSTCAVQVVNNASAWWNNSCAWEVLPAGVTQITPTMAASGQTGFLIYQVHRNDGHTWALDAQNSTTISSPSTTSVACPSLSVSGTNEVIFQQGSNQGQMWGGSPNYYIQPYINDSGWSNAVLQGNAQGAAGFNMTQYYQCVWMSVQQGAANPVAMYAVAFK